MAHREPPQKRSATGRKKPVFSWQRSELARFLGENAMNPAVDSKTVFLANPGRKNRIDRVIEAYLFFWDGEGAACKGGDVEWVADNWMEAGEEKEITNAFKAKPPV